MRLILLGLILTMSTSCDFISKKFKGGKEGQTQSSSSAGGDTSGSAGDSNPSGELLWKNSVCGNKKCEPCEAKGECCQYPPTKDKDGKVVYSQNTCMGNCPNDCTGAGSGDAASSGEVKETKETAPKVENAPNETSAPVEVKETKKEVKEPQKKAKTKK